MPEVQRCTALLPLHPVWPHLDKVVDQRELGVGRKADAPPVLLAELPALLLAGGGGVHAAGRRALLGGLQSRAVGQSAVTPREENFSRQMAAPRVPLSVAGSRLTEVPARLGSRDSCVGERMLATAGPSPWQLSVCVPLKLPASAAPCPGKRPVDAPSTAVSTVSGAGPKDAEETEGGSCGTRPVFLNPRLPAPWRRLVDD